MVKAQEWLDKEYPVTSRKEVTALNINNKNLEGELNLTEFTNLKELIITTRNWESFFNWLNENIVDINEKGPGKGNVKEAKRSEYPNLISAYNLMSYLMNSLEYHLGRTPLDYTGSNYQNQHKEPLLPYDDTKTFFQLASGNGNSFKCGCSFTLPAHQNWLNEYEKLLSEWRISTTKNISIKLEPIENFKTQIQELKKQVYGYEKTNLQALLTKKEQELTKAKESIITTNNLNEDNQEELDNLLELQIELINNNSSSLAQKQLTRSKNKLNKVITQEEISLLCRLQTELIELQNQEQELEAKIELPPR